MCRFGVGEEPNGLEVHKSDIDGDDITAMACLPIEGFLNTDAVHRFAEKNLADFRSIKAVCRLVVGFR